MPKRRRSRSIDEIRESDGNAIVQSALRSAKNHLEYKSIFTGNNVVDLRDRARVYGQKGWYCMKKPNLVSVIVVNKSATTISNFFRGIVQTLRKSVISRSVESDDVCPITLTPVSELLHPYVHDGIVFSRDDLVLFFLKSYNFTNPMTRKEFTNVDIKRFGSPKLCDLFYDREYLRKDAIYDIHQFSFLESQFEILVKHMVALYHHQDDQEYEEVVASIENMWKEMMLIDINRTLCVIKSTRSVLNDISGRRKKWATAFLDNLDNRSRVIIA